MAKLLLCTPDVLLQFPFAEGLGIAAESMEHHLAPEKKGELLVELQRHAVGIANDHRNVILEIETAIRRYTANGENKHLRFNGAYPAGISFLLALEKLGANTTDVRVLETVRAAESSYWFFAEHKTRFWPQAFSLMAWAAQHKVIIQPICDPIDHLADTEQYVRSRLSRRPIGKPFLFEHRDAHHVRAALGKTTAPLYCAEDSLQEDSLAARIGVDWTDVAFVGTTPYDIRLAKRAGVSRRIFFRHDVADEMPDEARNRITSLNDLPQVLGW